MREEFRPFEWLATTVITCPECGALGDKDTFAHRPSCTRSTKPECEFFETGFRTPEERAWEDLRDQLEQALKEGG